MAQVSGSAAPAGGASGEVQFVLDRFDVAHGRLEVAGRWTGVTGRRFVRPVLQVHGERRLIALLDHKPWSADDGADWLAAFPFDGAVGPSRLQVAPDIAVEIPASGPDAGDATPRPARLAPVPPRPRKRPDEPPAEPEVADQEKERLRAEADLSAQERDRMRADADHVHAELDGARREIEDLRTELDHTRADADRLKTELSHVRAEANTLRPAHDETAATAERLEGEVARLRTEVRRALDERNAAQAELERARRTGTRQPYIAPRPMAFHHPEPRADWRLRAVALVLLAALLVVALQVVFGVL